ncbi:hypothetical protein RhiirA1_480531, partial [Rhizophagus irregularis]
PSRRFRTDKTSQKNPQDTSELTKHLGRNDPRLRYEISASALIFGLGFGSVMELSAPILDLDLDFLIGMIPIFDLDLDRLVMVYWF